ncbi:Transposase [Novosphingobium aromaticivorans]|uniref:transposase n=1 Tax=Novosphingobium aromaticivorans TaxID=48935 RepID=UPI0000389C0A|nr:Transposase [Novosphingobium aromaticivorans]
MTDSNPRNYVHAEVLGGVQRRRRWTPEEKLRMVEETFLPGNSVSRVARMHGVAPNQLFGWRRQAASGALTATRAGGEGSCQSNRNLSPICATWADCAGLQAMSVCHSARAAERRCL